MKFKKCFILSGLHYTRRFAFTHTLFNVVSYKEAVIISLLLFGFLILKTKALRSFET